MVFPMTSDSDPRDGPASDERPTAEDETPSLVHGGGVSRFLATFLLSYGFYLALGDPFDPFDLVSGLGVAGAVAVLLSRTLFEEAPRLGRTLPRLARATLFVPYLLYEVAKANVAVSYVVLHPSLPIDPALVTVEDVPEERIEQAALANAITLTPGTLTVDVDEGGFVVHTLTEASRTGLLSGSLSRAVAFVFHGRNP
jgi:multicomponent Na+:H+ antiporter subunit E